MAQMSPLRQRMIEDLKIRNLSPATHISCTEICPGYAGKQIVGRKRHIAVDTDGRLLMVHLTPADISDSAGAQVILDGIRKRWPWVKHRFADGATTG